MSDLHEIAEIPVADPSAELPPVPARPGLGVRALTILVITIPLAGVIAAPFLVWGWGFGWTDLGVLLAMYVLTILGVTVGFHRLFVHRSFEARVPVQVALAILGSMAVQGSLFQWVGLHRRHHRYSDQPADPHTPHHHGAGIAGLIKGVWHAHIGWFFDPNPPDLDHYLKDLAASRTLRVVNALFPLWIGLGLLLPAMIGGLMSRSWHGFWTGLIWGGPVRLFLVHHVTWSINSACHLWGRRPYRSGDMSRNNAVFGVLGMGEGWHNTHHAFPTSVRHGLRWWQIDVSYWVIRLLAACGLAWNLKLPSPTAQEAGRLDRTHPPEPQPG